MSQNRALVVCALLALGLIFGYQALAPDENGLQSRALAAADLALERERTPLRGDPLDRRIDVSNPSSTGRTPVPARRFIVVSSDGEPLGGAQVHLLCDGGIRNRLLGLTDEFGSLNAIVPAAEQSCECFAIHARGTGRSSFRGQETIRIRLDPAGELFGSVVDLSGVPVPDITVLAVPCSLTEFSTHVSLVECSSHPEVHSARTEPDGTFHFEVLSPEREYRLVAGGSGFVLVKPPPIVHAGPEAASLTVAHLYGARVVLVDQAGRSIEPPRVAGGGFGIRMHPIDPTFRFIAGNGLSASLSMGKEGPTDRPGLTCFLLAADRVSAGTRIVVEGSVPGYAPFNAVVGVPPITAGFPDSIVTLVGEGRVGPVRLRLAPPPEALSRCRGGVKGIVYLVGAAGELQFGVSFDANGAAETAPVPYGEYRATLSLDPDGVFESREANLVVPQPAYDWVVDVSGTGGLLIDGTSLDSDGMAGTYARGIRIFVGRGVPSAAQNPGQQSLEGASISFASGPFILPVVRAGDYTLLIQEPRRSSTVVPFSVTAGEMSRVPLVIRD